VDIYRLDQIFKKERHHCFALSLENSLPGWMELAEVI
jgi:hypothetical protein